jgi:hypothetical protein
MTECRLIHSRYSTSDYNDYSCHGRAEKNHNNTNRYTHGTKLMELLKIIETYDQIIKRLIYVYETKYAERYENEFTKGYNAVKRKSK